MAATTTALKERPESVPYGYCWCGCGKQTNLAVKTERHRNTVRGEPLRYIRGHRAFDLADVQERFERRVLKKGPDDCWLWLGGTAGGYGYFNTGKKLARAHRFAYELWVGPIPEGKFILHSCDVRRCCNPAHLRPGTAKENTADARKRGRLLDPPNPSGEDHPNSVLSERQVYEIRSLYDQGWQKVDIAAAHGLSSGAAVNPIGERKTWKHLPEKAMV